jgi:hypothetical protein
MRGHIAFAAALLFMLCFSSPSLGEQFVTIKDDVSGFTVSYPSSWKQIEQEGSMVLGLLSPEEGASDSYLENLTIVKMTDNVPIDLEKMAKEPNPAAMGVTGFKDLGQSVIKVGATQALRSDCLFLMRGLELRQLQYVFAKDRTEYVLTFTSTSKSYNKWESLFRKIAESFRLHGR